MLKERKKNEQPKQFFKSITCECGFEILLVPDLNEMVNAVNAHVLEHCRKEKDPKKAVSESARLWNLLAAQIFEKAAANIDATE